MEKPPLELRKLVPPEPARDTSLESLSREFRPLAEKLEKRCAELGQEFRRIETRRTTARQAWLFALGRTVPNLSFWPLEPGQPMGPTVTMKDGRIKIGNHQTGDAADYWPIIGGKIRCPPLWLNARQKIYHPAWDLLRAVCLEMGLRWGGAWGDGPHVERSPRKMANGSFRSR